MSQDILRAVLPPMSLCEPIAVEKAPWPGHWLYTTGIFEGLPDERWDIMAYAEHGVIQWVKLNRITA